MGNFTETHNKRNILPVTPRSSSCEEMTLMNVCVGCKQQQSNDTFSHMCILFTEYNSQLVAF